MIVQKGSQVTKPITVVKVPCKLLYVIQVFNFLALLDIRVFGRLYITIVASDWPRTFFTPKVFYLAYILKRHIPVL